MRRAFGPSTFARGVAVLRASQRPISGSSERIIHLSYRGRQRPTGALGFPPTIFQTVRHLMQQNGDYKVENSAKWWNDDTTAVVTGANKGIGKAIAQVLAQNGVQVIVTARDESRGVDAVKELQKATGSDRIIFEQLDISDSGSINAFAKRLGDKKSDFRILINNAGIAWKGNAFGAEEAQQTISTNFLGTKAVCEALLPLLGDGGRIVNVCSSAGKQRIIKDKALLQRFNDAKTEEDVEKLAAEFVSGIRSGDYQSRGWPGTMYGVSKLCEATYTRVLAGQVGSKIDVNACCPGYVDTDMTSHRGIKTPLQGADTPAWLALLAPKGISGKFFSDRHQESY